jgi:hypothetical protein
MPANGTFALRTLTDIDRRETGSSALDDLYVGAARKLTPEAIDDAFVGGSLRRIAAPLSSGRYPTALGGRGFLMKLATLRGMRRIYKALDRLGGGEFNPFSTERLQLEDALADPGVTYSDPTDDEVAALREHGIAVVNPDFARLMFELGARFSGRVKSYSTLPADFFAGDPLGCLAYKCPRFSYDDRGVLVGDPVAYAARALSGGVWDKIKNSAKKIAGKVSKVANLVADAASFIPGVGTLVSTGAKLVGKVADKVSSVPSDASAGEIVLSPAPKSTAAADVVAAENAPSEPAAAVKMPVATTAPAAAVESQIYAPVDIALRPMSTGGLDRTAERALQTAASLGFALKGDPDEVVEAPTGVMSMFVAPFSALVSAKAADGNPLSGGVETEGASDFDPTKYTLADVTKVYSSSEGVTPKLTPEAQAMGIGLALNSAPNSVSTSSDGTAQAGSMERFPIVWDTAADSASRKAFKLPNALWHLYAGTISFAWDKKSHLASVVRSKPLNKAILLGMAVMANDPDKYARDLAAATWYGVAAVNSKAKKPVVKLLVEFLNSTLALDARKGVEGSPTPEEASAAAVALGVAALAAIAMPLGKASGLSGLIFSEKGTIPYDIQRVLDSVEKTFDKEEAAEPAAAQMLVKNAQFFLQAVQASAGGSFDLQKVADGAESLLTPDEDDVSDPASSDAEQDDAAILKAPHVIQMLRDAWQSAEGWQRVAAVAAAVGLSAAAVSKLKKLWDEGDESELITGLDLRKGTPKWKRPAVIPMMGPNFEYYDA